ncbi:PDR/VanB family oxidoreductase [Nocardioides sp. R1-1]|uniref:PDR/VanB family oxidoreductase n=1 Tax=Nocardioides sp. R1-1 TaxID=3383502 RepID=UPI0038D1E479
MPPTATLRANVVAKEMVADGVVLLTLAGSEAAELPPWHPGAHIDLHLGDPSRVRQYSLCSSPADLTTYQVAVLREPQGRGGSSFVHDVLAVGDEVRIGGPRNNFGLVDAGRYLFIAGGIGITPIVPMIQAAHRAGADWSLMYGGRTAASMAFTEQLLAIGGRRVLLRPQDQYGHLDIPCLLAEPDPDALIYCCGPEPLLAAVQAASAHWSPGSLHVERFAARPVEEDGTDSTFEVEFVRSGVSVTVSPEESIVDVAEAAGVPVVYSCQEGTCGSCEVAVLDGEPDHRDSILSGAEREAGKTIMVCVSRAKSDRIVLDL